MVDCSTHREGFNEIVYVRNLSTVTKTSAPMVGYSVEMTDPASVALFFRLGCLCSVMVSPWSAREYEKSQGLWMRHLKFPEQEPTKPTTYP